MTYQYELPPGVVLTALAKAFESYTPQLSYKRGDSLVLVLSRYTELTEADVTPVLLAQACLLEPSLRKGLLLDISFSQNGSATLTFENKLKEIL